MALRAVVFILNSFAPAGPAVIGCGLDLTVATGWWRSDAAAVTN
jgi:hypothetical protein